MAFSQSAHSRIGHFVAKDPTSVVNCLRSHFRVDEARANELLGLGAVYLGKSRRVLEDEKLKAQDYLRVHLQPKRYPASEVDWAKAIVHQDPEFIVVRKPSGIPVHATLDNLTENVLHGLRAHLKGPLLITQRLDVPVSGLLVFARTPQFQKWFNFWLSERKVYKRYAALVPGPLSPKLTVGQHRHFMEPSERAPRRVEAVDRPGWQHCDLTIHAIDAVRPSKTPLPEGTHQVSVELHTGRTHQIRAQLAALGSPVLGDRLYGSRSLGFTGDTSGEAIALHSVRVGWPKPGKKGSGNWDFSIAPAWL